MRAVLFEGTPEEFARVEAAFRAGGRPGSQTRTIALPRARPKAWPELDEEQCHRLARRVLERAPARLVEALAALADAQNLSSASRRSRIGPSRRHRLPEELCGMLAELGRGASRAFIELFGCDNAPQRVKGAAYMLLQKVPSAEGACFVLRPGLMRALADLDLLDVLPSSLEDDEADAVGPGALAAARPPSPPVAKAPNAAMPPPPGRSLAPTEPQPPRAPGAARSGGAPPSGPPGGLWDQVARLLAPLAFEGVMPKGATGGPRGRFRHWRWQQSRWAPPLAARPLLAARRGRTELMEKRANLRRCLRAAPAR